jgi:hypothetical protein
MLVDDSRLEHGNCTVFVRGSHMLNDEYQHKITKNGIFRKIKLRCVCFLSNITDYGNGFCNDHVIKRVLYALFRHQ